MQEFARQMRNVGRKQAKDMRERARDRALERKAEYLGARVPKELRDRVIARAAQLGIPVSILIRNTLEEAFGRDRSAAPDAAVRGAEAERRGADGTGFPGVIGWKQIVLNRTMGCASCGRDIEAGASATLGIALAGEDHVILCARCKGPG